MRLASVALSSAALGLVMLPAGASASGGATSPTGGGGAVYAPRSAESGHSSRRGPLLTEFELRRPRLFLYGRPARVTFRIKSRFRSVRVRLRLVRLRGRRAVSTISLGQRPTRVRQSVLLTGRENGILPQGRYLLRIGAVDRRGRHLRRRATVSRSAELSFFHHRFPLVGPYNFGGPGARFGAPRNGHTHQGQDVIAAEGTPIVAPRGGTVTAVQYQAGGAGYYVVLDGERERYDYVFMHLLAGSTRVRPGQRVRTGQRIGDVGATGDAQGPHLHFEMWLGPWYTGGYPIDPLPFLQRWASWS